jgi:hypothetical protein
MVPFPDFLKWTIIVLIPSVIIHFLVFLRFPMGDVLCASTFVIIAVIVAIMIYSLLWYTAHKKKEGDSLDEVDQLLEGP